MKFLIFMLLAVPLAAQQPVIEEWQVPWPDTRPRDPYVAPNGVVWFAGQQGHYLGTFDTTTKQFERYDLQPGAGPHNLVVAPDGAVWYAGNRVAHIGRLDPASGAVRIFPMPDPAARDPHTLVFDGRGNIWFTLQRSNMVGRLGMADGSVELVAIPTRLARPYGIVVDPQGRPWVTLFGTNKLATVDPETMEVREIETPRPEARLRRLALTSDGAVWYVDYQGGYLGRYEPATGDIREWAAPGADRSRPYGTVADAGDRIWFVETGLRPNRLVGFDTRAESFLTPAEIPSGGGSVRHMYYHHETGTIWFGTDSNMLARVRLP